MDRRIKVRGRLMPATDAKAKHEHQGEYGFGIFYDKTTGRCTCNRGWTGQKCQGSLKLIIKIIFKAKMCENTQHCMQNS